MELNKLDVKSAEEEGAFLHLTHPSGKFPMYTGKGADEYGFLFDENKDHEPVGVMVRGIESPTVKDTAKGIERRKMRKKRGQVNEEKDGLDFACSLVIEFRGIFRDGEPLEATDENKREFFEKSDKLVRQVLDFAQEGGNFFKGERSD